ncbi:MAG: hypothetical protein MUP04_06625 [Anaerolineae bacterium]|nr:hypothetical protein [Anaerolineae bacterium]
MKQQSLSPTPYRDVALASRINLGLDSNEELAWFLERYLGLRIPDKRVCADHEAPFSFVADIFFGRVVDAVVWSCRSGGKSFNEALLTFLDSHFRPKCDTRVLAGSFYQGRQVYDATLDFWQKPEWHQFLASELTKSETLLKNGSGYEVLTASQKSVRGPHPQRLKLDELARDLYDAALSQPQSRHGIPASLIMTSTMHRVYGLMQEVIDNRHKMGLKLYKWCWLEVVDRCDEVCEKVQDPRSICHGRQCNLWEDCQGKAHDAAGYYAVEDVRKKKAQLPADTWESEWLVKRPTARDMVYDPEDLEAATSHEIAYDPAYPSFGMADPGFVNPTAFCVAQERGDDVAVVEEWYWEQVLLSERVRRVKQIYHDYGLRGIYADGENKDFIEELGAAGMKVVAVSFAQYKAKSVEKIRQFLKDRRLRISTACPNLIREMFRLHFWKEEVIAKEDDHGPDALVALFRRYLEITQKKVVQTVRLP